MLPMWSIEDNASTGTALFGIWYERYKKTYGEFNDNSKNLKKPQYNYLIWNSIIDKSRRRKRLKSSYHEGTLDILIEAQRSATGEGRNLLNPGTVTYHFTESGEIAADENAQVVDEADKATLPMKQLKYQPKIMKLTFHLIYCTHLVQKRY